MPLFVVGTPIGNLEDLTPRALRTLREADAVACEDTRTTLKLLTHFEIRKPVLALFGRSGEAVLERLKRGESIALVSEAGTPGVSDPGADLVGAALEAGVPVRAIPGPSAVASAASVSGFPADRFVFEGFLPRKPGKRRKALRALRGETRTILLYESPHRIVAALEDMLAELGDRRITVARELTKLHEEVRRTTVAKALEHWRGTKPRGEFTIAIEGSGPDHDEGGRREIEDREDDDRHPVEPP